MMIAVREYRKWGVSLKLMVAVVAFVVAIVAFASDQKIWSGYWGDAVFNNEPTSVRVDAPAFANKIDADVDAMIEKCSPDTTAWKTAYKYFRFYVDAPRSNNDCMQLSDIMLLNVDGNEISSDNFKLAWDSNGHGESAPYPADEAPGNAVDGKHDTKWLDTRAGFCKSAEKRASVYVEFQFERATNIYGYKWYTADDASDRDPTAWHITASNDGKNWTTLDIVSGYNPTQFRKTLAFERYFAELCAFRYYRFKVDEVRGDGDQYMQISDVGLYGADGARLINDKDFTLTCAGDNMSGQEGEAKAVDTNSDGTGNVDTKWGTSTSNGNTGNVWIQYNMVSAVKVSKYNWSTANDTKTNIGRNPKSWRLLASDDCSSWYPVDVVVNNTSITTENKKKAYEKSFDTADSNMTLVSSEFDVASGKTLAIKSGFAISAPEGISKVGSGTLRLGGKDGATFVLNAEDDETLVNPWNGFAVASGTLNTTNVAFRLGGVATSKRDAPFVVANGDDATAVLNGGSIYSVSEESEPYNAFQIGVGSGNTGRLFATNVNVTTRGRIRLATGEGSTAVVEKVGGDWKVQENVDYGRFYMGEGQNSSSEFYHRGGTLETWGYLCIGSNGESTRGGHYFELDGGTVTQDHNDYIHIGDHGGAGVSNELCVKNGTLNAREHIRVSYNAPGLLTIDGGEVNAPSGQIVVSCSSESGRAGTVALNGGVLKTQAVVHGGGVEEGTLIFNGGTLKAVQDGDILPANEKLIVKVANGGAKIDTAGHTVLASASIAPDTDSTGGLWLLGGGLLELAAGNTYTGATTVELGTTIKVALYNDIQNGITVAFPENGAEDGVYRILTLTGNECFDKVPDNVSMPSGGDCELRLSADKKSIVCIYGNPENSWTGGSAGGNLSDPNNWSSGVVPTHAIIKVDSEAVFTKDDDDDLISSITIEAGSAAVTIKGGFKKLTSIVNNSAANLTFTDFVDFGENKIDVRQTATLDGENIRGGVVNFAGGVRGYDIQNHTILTGHYTLTKSDGDFNAREGDKSRITINKNSSLSVLKSYDTHELLILDGGKFMTEEGRDDSKNRSNDRKRAWYKNHGVYVATSFKYHGKDDQMWMGSLKPSGSSGILKIGRLDLTESGELWLHGYDGSEKSDIYIGAGGINISGSGYVGIENERHTQTLWPWNSDYTINGGTNADYDLLLRDKGHKIVLNLQTKDEEDVPRTVTLNGRISTNGDSTKTINVLGTGTNVVEVAQPLMEGTYAVADTATLILKAGAGFPNGILSLGAGTTLSLASNIDDRTLTPPAATIALPSTGMATIRIDGQQRLTAGDHILGEVTGLQDGVDINNVLTVTGTAVGDRPTLRVENGSIILNVRPIPFKVIVR